MTNFWLKLPKPFTVLAPMENVTDYVFREVISVYLPKPDVLFTEFTNVEALDSLGFDKTIHKLKFSSRQKPIVAQIWGTDPEKFFKSAKLIEKLGFDGIDINMGCPIKDIVKTGACSALINNKSLAKEIIDAVKKATKKLPISVKTRIGVKEVKTTEWISFLLEQKLSALTIHARTAYEQSKYPARWEEIEKAVKLKSQISPSTIIIGNGDITSYKEVVNVYQKHCVDGVMIDRGIFKNPFVFSKKEETPTSSDLKEVLLKHLDLYNNFYIKDQEMGVKKPFDVMKKFFKMYINNFKGANVLRIKLMETKTIEEAKDLITNSPIW